MVSNRRQSAIAWQQHVRRVSYKGITMPIQVSWYQEKRVVLVQAWGEVSLQDLGDSNVKIAAYIRQGGDTTSLIHVLAGVRTLKRFPTNLSELRQGNTYLREPALGWVVLVGMSPLVRFLGGMVTQIMQTRFRMFPTFGEAFAFLKSQDEAILKLTVEPK